MLKYNNYVFIKSIIFSLIACFSCCTSLAQNGILGQYSVINYEKENFEHGTQNWQGISLNNGYTFFANNSGLLLHTGTSWKKYSLPNQTIVRSIASDENDNVYIGGQDEIGYFSADSIGHFIFHSIREYVPEKYLPLEDIWKMAYVNNKLYFLSTNRVFIYQEGKEVEIIDTGNPISYLGNVANEVYFSDLYKGIYHIHNDLSYTLLEWSSSFQYMPIVDILKDEQENYIVLTELAGAFKYDGQLAAFEEYIQSFLRKNRIHDGATLSDGSIAVGTQFGGVIVIGNEEHILEHYAKESGLQNENILSLHEDPLDNLWIGTSNGIDKVLRSEPVRTVVPDGDNEGAIYDIIRFYDLIFFGTNNGLFYLDLNQKFDALSKPYFQKVRNTDGQVWGLDTIDNRLLIGHNEGALIIRNGEAIRFSKEPGVWSFHRIDQNHMYVGTYTGVHVYEYKDGEWIFLKELAGFEESSRIIAQVRKNELWVSHPYRGVYRIQHDDAYENVELTLYDETLGLPSLMLNHVFNIDNDIVVTGMNNIYRYDRLVDRFMLDDRFVELIDTSTNTRRLFQYNDRIYYINENEVGLISSDNHHLTKRALPELQGLFVGGFENLVQLDDETILACTDRGAIRYNLSKQSKKLSSYVNFVKIALLGDEEDILYNGHGDTWKKHNILNHNQKAIRFEVSSSDHTTYSKYRYKLEGIDEEWSQWSKQYVKEYNNLSHGSYRMMVEVINKAGNIGDPAVFTFSISPPWYQSKVAYFLYAFLVLISIINVYRIPNKKYRKEKEELTQAKNNSESELEKLKNERLKNEIELKNRELASSTLHLVQKNETINKLRIELNQIFQNIKDSDAKKEIRKVLSVLSDDDRLEQDWESFSNHFDQVHSDFLKRIKKGYPQLTPKDLKMAAYLRLNLSSKEIAPLLNISVRGVEVGRYRLRKKMDLDKNTNLSEFMISY